MPTLPALMLYSGCALGAAGLVIWLLGLLARRKPTVPSTPAALALAGVGGYFAGTYLTGLGMPLLTLAGLLLVIEAVRSDWLICIVSAVSTFLCRPLCQWTALAVSCSAAAALVAFSAAPSIERLPQEP